MNKNTIHTKTSCGPLFSTFGRYHVAGLQESGHLFDKL